MTHKDISHLNNPCSLVTLPPRPQGKKRRALPAEQLSDFLKAAKEDRWYVIFIHGENVKVVCDRLGHSDPAFTLRVYVDTDDTQQKTASEKLARILAR